MFDNRGSRIIVYHSWHCDTSCDFGNWKRTISYWRWCGNHSRGYGKKLEWQRAGRFCSAGCAGAVSWYDCRKKRDTKLSALDIVRSFGRLVCGTVIFMEPQHKRQ